MTEQLTDGEREALVLWGILPALGDKALRIIDAHAADRAALVAQLEAAKATLEMCAGNFDAMVEERAAKDAERERADALVAQVAELTRERDEARGERDFFDRERQDVVKECEALRAQLMVAGRDVSRLEHLARERCDFIELVKSRATHAESNPLLWYQGRRWYEWAGMGALLLVYLYLAWRAISG